MDGRAFFELIESGDPAAVQRALVAQPGLVRERARPDCAPPEQDAWTPLHHAVLHGRDEVALLLIACGAPLDVPSGPGRRNPLHDAIEYSRMRVVEAMLEAGAPIDPAAAAILGRLEDLRRLLEEDPRRADDESTGLAPICWAAYGNQAAAIRLLLERGARLDPGALHCAASCGHADAVRALLESGADPDSVSEDGCSTPLILAARMPFTCDASGVTRILLDAGADPSFRNAEGRTALDYARAGRSLEIEDHPSAEPQECKAYDAVIALLEEGGSSPRAV